MAFTAGKYRARLSKQGLGQNENTKNYQIMLQFDVLGRYNGVGQLEACDPGPRTVWRVITDKTAERVADELRALGFTGESFAQVDEQQGGTDFISLAGVECDLVCRYEEYQGQTKERWELNVLGGSASAGKPVERKQVREIDAKFGKFLKASPARPAPRKTAASAPIAVGPAQESDGESVPF